MVNVEIISEVTIKPSNPTPDHLRYLKASLFDQLNMPTLMPLIFFYSPKTSPNTSDFLDRLESSLSTTLSMFYPLAGRVQDANYIACNDEGVPFIRAKVNEARLSDVVYKVDSTFLDKLVPSYGQDGFSRLMLAIQVTQFACGGVAIGVKFNHAVGDAFSKLMFVKAWSAMANNMPPEVLEIPYFEIWKLFPPSPRLTINNVSFGPNPNLMNNRPATKWFLFREAKLQRLRSTLYNSSSSSSDRGQASLDMVLSAFIWSRIKLGSNGKRDDNVPFEAFHVINIRPKVSPPVEGSYFFGNMLIKAFVRPSMEAKDTVSLCHSFLSETKASMQERWNNDELIRAVQQGREDFSSEVEYFQRKMRGEIFCYIISSLRSLPTYDSDFGWGKPIWVAPASYNFKDVVILIPASPSSKDICAYLYLTDEQIC